MLLYYNKIIFKIMENKELEIKIIKLLKNKEVISAIKELRTIEKISLIDAKEKIDKLRLEHPELKEIYKPYFNSERKKKKIIFYSLLLLLFVFTIYIFSNI